MRTNLKEQYSNQTNAFAQVDIRELDELRDPCAPDKELLRCVLIRGIQDATGNTLIGGDKPYAAEIQAVEWIKSQDTETRGYFPFEWICEQLDVNPEPIRRMVLEAIERGEKLSVIDTTTHRIRKSDKFR